MLAVSSQEEFTRRIDQIPAFRGMPSPTCLGDLKNAGIELEADDVDFLALGLERIGSSEEIELRHPGRITAEVAREERIASLTSELRDLIAECKSDNGRRYASWNDNILEYEEVVDLNRLDDDLQILWSSSQERSDLIRGLKKIGLGPKSGNGNPDRFFYWMTLLAFWEFWLYRNPRPSAGGSPGRVVDFIRIMSAGNQSDDSEEFSVEALRSFVDRHRVQVRDFALRFIPRYVIALKNL